MISAPLKRGINNTTMIIIDVLAKHLSVPADDEIVTVIAMVVPSVRVLVEIVAYVGYHVGSV